MRDIWVIAKKELKIFLFSPIAYILTAFFLLISGFFFYNIMVWFSNQSTRLMQDPYYAGQINLNKMVLEPYFNNLTVILIFLIPLVEILSLSKRISFSCCGELILNSCPARSKIFFSTFCNCFLADFESVCK